MREKSSRTRGNRSRSAPTNTELGHVPIRKLSELKASPENDNLYGPVDPNDFSVRELAESIRQHGFNGSLVISLDDYILSGHRRRVAATLAGLVEVPCITDPIYRRHPDTPFVTNPDFVAKLEAYNRQRVKSLDDMLHEAVVKANPDDAHRALTQYCGSSGYIITLGGLRTSSRFPKRSN